MGTAGFEPGTHAWLAGQSGALAIASRPLLLLNIIKKNDRFTQF